MLTFTLLKIFIDDGQFFFASEGAMRTSGGTCNFVTLKQETAFHKLFYKTCNARDKSIIHKSKKDKHTV